MLRNIGRPILAGRNLKNGGERQSFLLRRTDIERPTLRSIETCNVHLGLAVNA